MRISDWSSDVCSSDLAEPLELVRTAEQQAVRFAIIAAARTQVDDPGDPVCALLQLTVEAGPAIGVHLAFQCGADILFAARTQLDRHAPLGAPAHAFADIVAVDDEVGAGVGFPPPEDVEGGIVGGPSG